MTLNATGPISLGGTTTGQSINLELAQSATAQISLNDTNVRTLAGIPSGAIIIPTNFYGKSRVYTYSGTMTQGTTTSGGITFYGFERPSLGSISPDDTTIFTVYKFQTGGIWYLKVQMSGSSNPSNFWTTLTLAGTFSINSSSATSFINGSTWEFANTDPAPLTGSGTISLVFS